jgi:pilus assembly protein Flp/PilA
MQRIRHFLEDESGASAIEYALLIALIGLACIYAIKMLGINIAAAFTTVANAISAAS